jgi:hypothetical protein
MDGIKNGIKHDPMRFFDFANYKRKTVGYPSSMRYDNSVCDCPADICELFADLFESVHNVDSCGLDAEDVTVNDYIFFSVKSSFMSAQHGFFKGRSTVTNLIEFTSYVWNCMENGVHVDAIIY